MILNSSYRKFFLIAGSLVVLLALGVVLGLTVVRIQNQKATISQPRAAPNCSPGFEACPGSPGSGCVPSGTCKSNSGSDSNNASGASDNEGPAGCATVPSCCGNIKGSDFSACSWDGRSTGGSRGWCTWDQCGGEPLARTNMNCGLFRQTYCTVGVSCSKDSSCKQGLVCRGGKCSTGGGDGGGGGASYTATSPKGGEAVSVTPTFTWTANTTGINYNNICVGSDATCMNNPCPYGPSPSDRSYTVPSSNALSPNTTYYWSIYGQPGNPAPSSKCESFKTGEAPPELPTSCSASLDCSGQSNTGVATNTTVIDGKVGKARDFPGHSIVAIKSYSRINLAGSVTVMAWIKPGSLPAGHNRYIWSRGSNQFGEYRFYQNGSELGFGFTANGAWKQHLTKEAGLSAGSWQHVAAVLDTGAGKVRIYLNGVEKYAGAETAGLTKNPLPFAIGRIADQDEGTFDGGIDEVRLYSRALTATEIAAYSSGLSNDGLVGWWPMDETSGNTAADASRKCSGGSCVDLLAVALTHLECLDSTCKAVSGGGDNKDGCTTAGAACSAGGEVNACWGNGGNNGRCYDCNGDGEVNILDFSCFRSKYNQNVL